jgi:ketosteroid isomerase-like protein
MEPLMRGLWFALATVLLGATPTAAQPAGSPERAFERFLDAVDAAQVELQNGRPAAFKALWSQREDITLAGGFGGPVSRGWADISARLDAVGQQFSNGRHRATRLASSMSGDLGYVVQVEHIDYRVPGQASDTSRDYRVTMVFRREADGWRIVHRQADTQLTNQMTR